MKNRQMVILFCAIAIGLVAAISTNAGLTVFHSTTPNDLPNLPHLAVLNAYAETAPATSQADFEFKTNSDYNDFSYDLKPAINTETWTQTYHLYHHCP